MSKSRVILLTMLLALVATLIVSCDKAPSGVIKETDMAHVIAELAKANALIEQNSAMFPDDSSKLALKQSILKKYDADLAMYDSSLVWYAHNLKIYAEVSDKALALLEKEANVKHDKDDKNGTASGGGPAMPGISQAQIRRVFPSDGDSADLWKEPQQLMLTSALSGGGHLTWDYTPDRESRKGDIYSLNFKVLSTSGNSTKVLLAIDYSDGCTSFISRTASSSGWTSFNLQADTARTVKRIYGFIKCGIKAHNVTFIDSIYLLRTHFDPSRYNMINIQRLVGPKAVLNKGDTPEMAASGAGTPPPASSPTVRQDSFPGMPSKTPKLQGRSEASPMRPSVGRFQPKPGLNKAVIPSRERAINPNGAHVPRKPQEKR